MQRLIVVFQVLAVVLALAFGASDRPSRLAAQELPPPEVGATVMADALGAGDIVREEACPSGLGGTRITEQGYLMTSAGRCSVDAPAAFVSARLRGLLVPDGEARLEFRPVAGVERLSFQLWIRDTGPRYVADV